MVKEKKITGGREEEKEGEYDDKEDKANNDKDDKGEDEEQYVFEHQISTLEWFLQNHVTL